MGITIKCIILLIITFLKVMVTGQVSVITGERQKCSNEGEPVTMSHQLNQCFSCICKHGLVECQPYCQPTDGCYFLISRKESDCCNRCKGCMYKGRYYDSHTEWTDSDDPCKILYCEAGVVTESDIQCYNHCHRPLRPKPGKCCGTCLGCRVNGILISNDRDITIPEDPCVKCSCEDGRTTCYKKACPVLHCDGIGKIYKAPGECCPKCNGTRNLMPIKKLCVVGTHTYKTNEKFDLDRCTQCICTNETAICRREACPVLKCDVKLQKTNPDTCCPYCEKTEIMEAETTCTVGGKIYQDGESWPLDSCKSCMCSEGQIRCAVQRCPPFGENDCPPNTRLEKPLGQCCATCVENDGVCTVFGDPHYKTFDGKFFSFQGSCKYLLTSDCLGNNTFSVRVTNEVRNKRYSAWTRTVAIKAGHLKVNLGQKMRIKVNGKKVEPPYSMAGIVNIEKEYNIIKVKTYTGLNVIWNGHGYLEVYASTKYKGRLCGLCGNFNSFAQDDLTMRNKRIVGDSDIWKFANSWKVGRRACGRLNEQYKKSFCKERKNKNCRSLKYGEQFGDCNMKLSPSNYYEACLQDMCECPSDNCYCDSFFAYARECERLNVDLPDWKKNTNCNGDHSRKKSGERQPLHHKPSNRRLLLNASRNFTSINRRRFHQPTKLPIK